MTPRAGVSAEALHALARSVLCIGFNGSDAASAPIDELRAFEPGAFILFARNIGTIPQLRELIAALRTCGAISPLVALDQEGGRVARIADERVAALPSAMAVGATGDPALCERLGIRLGRDLARLGVSVDFAPCADLALDPLNTVIGTRSYGASAESVGRFAAAFARGLQTGGVAAAVKHFPGHGATHVDSHVALPRIAADAATLRRRDVLPFTAAFAGGVAEIVMSAHVVVEALDPAQPATLSPRILTGLLREELGYGGLIATDCLEMDAIAETVGTAAGACAALAAGADLLLVSHRLERARAAADAVVAAVGNGTLPLARLTAAAARVRTLRERYAHAAPFGGGVDESEPLEAARRAVTVVRGDVRLAADRPVTVISFEGTMADGAGGPRTETPSLSAALRVRRWKSEIMRVALEPDDGDLDLLLSHLPSLGDRNFAIVARRAHCYPRQRAAIARILDVVPAAVLISAREPYDVALVPAAQRVACTYGDDALAFAGLADVLSGRAVPGGRLPVTLDRNAALR